MPFPTRRPSLDTLTLTGLGTVLAYAACQIEGRLVEQWQYCVLGLGLVCGLYWLLTKKSDSFKSSWIVLILPLYILLQFMTVSVNPAATFSHLLRVVSFTVVFITVREIARKEVWTAAIPIIIFAALEAGIGLLRYFESQDAAIGAHGTYINRNHFAGLLEMALPFAIMGAIKFKWLWAPAGIIFSGIVCSYSRGGYISTICALSLMGVLLAGAKWTGLLKWTATVPILAGAFLMLIYLPPEAFFDRFSKASEEQISTLGGRMLFAKQTPALIREYAVFGCGLGGFESAFFQVKDILPGHRVDYAHNDYLQGLIELGIVGFVVALVWIGSALKSAIRAGHIACIGAISAILLHSLVDFNLYIPANAMTFAWICGIAMSLRLDNSSHLNIVEPGSAGKLVGKLPGRIAINLNPNQGRGRNSEGLTQFLPIGRPSDRLCRG